MTHKDLNMHKDCMKIKVREMEIQRGEKRSVQAGSKAEHVLRAQQ